VRQIELRLRLFQEAGEIRRSELSATSKTSLPLCSA